MPEPWPVLTEETAVLGSLARRLVSTGAPLKQLMQAVAGEADHEVEERLSGLSLDPHLARAWLIGMLHEQAMALEQRRKQGAYYTPRGIANYMLMRCMAALGAEASSQLRFLDPAAGSGAFLLSALEVMRSDSCDKGSIGVTLTGCDLDAAALDSARHAVRIASLGSQLNCELVVLDSLLVDPPCGAGAYDIVAGNPPYLDSERLTRQQPGLRKKLRLRFRTARGNWDISCVFVERALELVRPGGMVAMLVPRKLLAADYAAALHELLLEHELVELCDLTRVPVFKAGVEAAVVIVRRSATTGKKPRILCRMAIRGPEADRSVTDGLLRNLPPGYLCAAFASDARNIASVLSCFSSLAQFAEVGDGCSTSEAYRLAELVLDRAEGAGLKLVNTGLIKPYASLWGLRELAYLKQLYKYPRLDAVRLEQEFPKRWRQARTPKLLLPGLARELWAVSDTAGEWACGKGAVQVLPFNGGGEAGLPLLAWLAWLNSKPVRELYRALFGGRGFGEGSLNIGPRQLKRLPVPIDGLRAAAGELEEITAQLLCSRQAWWASAVETAPRRGRINGADCWVDSPGAKRIDVIVTQAYGF